MSQTIELNAQARADVGKGASRRLRRDGARVPAILYGGGEPAQSLTLDFFELTKAMQLESFYSQIVTLHAEGKAQAVVVKDVQRHPANERVQHIDFQRVRADQTVDVHVPLHFINEDGCVGVKQGGGSIRHAIIEVLVRALPANLPEFIEVDVANLNVGESLHLSDLKVATGVELVELSHGADHDQAVVSVQPPRGSSADSETATATE